MVASAKIYKTNNATTEQDTKTLPDDAKLIQMGAGGSATGYWQNGEYHDGGPSIKPVDEFIEHVQKPVLEYIGEQGFHMGYSSNGDGTNGSLSVSVGPVEYNTNGGVKFNPNPIPQTGHGTSPSTIKPNAYRANAAGTASSIKQGGMTKNELIDFNIRHPNETMVRGQ